MPSQTLPAARLADAPAWPAAKGGHASDSLRNTGAATAQFAARLHRNLDAVMPLWLECQENGFCTAHQTYSWVENIARHLLPRNAELLVVEVGEAATGQPRMLVPLMRTSRLGYRAIEWPSCGVSDYSAPLLADGRSWTPGMAEAAWAAVKSVLPPADRIHIGGIPREIYGMPNPLAMLPSTRDSSLLTYGIALEGDPETVVKRNGRPSFVKTYNKDWRRLERYGAVELVEADTPASTELIFDALVEMRLKRFRKLGRFDLLARPSVVEFYHSAALAGLRDGSVRLFGLKAGDIWVAAQYALTRQHNIHTILVGIDQEAVPNCTPGISIMGTLMSWGLRHGYRYFDLSTGSLPYKEQFGAQATALGTLDETLTPLGKAVALGSSVRERATSAVRSNPKLLQAARGFMQRLRRLRN